MAALTLPALSQTSPIAPNGINVTSDTGTIPPNATYTFTVQMLYNGGPLRSEGVRVYYQSNDTSIIPAELGTYVLTGPDGIANITVTPLKAGYVKLSLAAMNAASGVTADISFHVTEGALILPTPTPAATPTAIPTTSPASSPTIAPTTAPTTAPTLAPTITSMPSATPTAGNTNSQAIGILTTGIALAVVLLIIAIILRSLGKK